MNNELQDYLNVIRKNLSLLQQTYHVKSIGIFGSVATATQTQSSDIDIMIELSEPIGFFAFLELESFLEQLLGRPVDLVTKPAIKPAILKEVVYV
ncbi:MAG: nucleotidyltransferase family protein [Candidatus Kerfeldbacteria bacterium]|nr:nucleotidyltransferase family protein [Candidatus Kerfeldbacteria bacterium]